MNLAGQAAKKQSYFKGAAILAATVALTKIIGAIYKIPLYNLLGDDGTGHFNKAYEVYNLMLAISTAGVPVALSRLISAARASGRYAQARRYYSVGMLVFSIIGVLGSIAMFVWAGNLAGFMKDAEISLAIKILSPAVLFSALVSVLRGYSQGHNDMVPTSLSQIMEVVCKIVVGLAVAWFLASRGENLATIAAGANVGVTAGMGLAIPVMAIYNRRIKRADATDIIVDSPASVGSTSWEIIKVSLPIAIGAAASQFITFFDSRIISDTLESVLGMEHDAAISLYGVYSKALALFNLPSAFITPVAVSVVPIIAAALAAKKYGEAKKTMESSMKLTNLFAMPAAVGLAVLSRPIFIALYGGTGYEGYGPAILTVFGAASFFVCEYIITNAILQASGHEKISALSLIVGGLIKLVLSWQLVSIPELNIIGAPIATLACYILISAANIVVMQLKLPEKPDLIKIVFRPFVCTAVMGAGAFAVYGLLDKLLLPHLSGGRLGVILCLGVTIIAAVVVYAALVLALKVVTREDVLILPKGEKIAKLLRLK